MTVLRLTGFLGENRATHPMLLEGGVGVKSLNQKPGRGDLRPWRQPTAVASVPAGRKTIYRMGRDVAGDANYWLSWATVVHAVRGFEGEGTSERTYYTGDGAPKVTDNVMAVAATPYPTTYRPMAMPAPSQAPQVAAGAAGEGQLETIFYVYTFVNDWGWESAPSPVSTVVEATSDADLTVSGFAPPPSGNYGIDRIRIYRTQAGETGADFFYVGEIAVGTPQFVDQHLVLGEVLPTKTWLPPPDDLHNLRVLWNGMMAGISGNSVRFCEAFIPYAWPLAYDVVPPDSKPVALGVFGQTLLVLTTGRPVLVAGSGPDGMDQRMLEMPQACISSRSVVGMGFGVVWASQDGLCFYGEGGPRVLTAGLMMREDWLKLKPETIIGQMYEGLYFGTYDDGTGLKGFFISPASPTGIYFTETGYPAMHFDELADQLYVLNGSSVQKWDTGALMTTVFRSKVTHMPKPVVAFGCAEVIADGYPVEVKFFADEALKHTQAVASAEPFRLPSGFIAQNWQVEVTSQYPVQAVAMAHSMKELATT